MVDTTHQPPFRNYGTGNLLDLREVVAVTTRFGNTLYSVKFIVAEKMGVDANVGAAFMNGHVDEILCREQNIRLQESPSPSSVKA